MSDANFISQADALELVGNNGVSFVDGSWYLPAQNRNGHEEYTHMRIPGAVFFDIDRISDPETSLPHMLPSPADFARAVSVMGISHDQLIIVYDGPGLFSAARVWWTFKIMGAPDVRILEGGLDAWKAARLPLETGNPNPPMAHLFETAFRPGMVCSMETVQSEVNAGRAVVLDARSADRFNGTAPEPRPGLRSGHMPGSISLPFDLLLENGQMKDPQALDNLFNSLGVDRDRKVITSCGSGVTAAILTLALVQSGRTNHCLFDGSWAEWGKPDGPPVIKDET